MKKFKAASAALFLSGVFLTGVSYADNFSNTSPVLTCPSVQTLNSIFREKGSEGLESFVDQGIGWEYATTLFQLDPSYVFTGLKGISIPSGVEKNGDQHKILCVYSGGSVSDIKKPSFDAFFQGVDPGPFTGVVGNWNVVRAHSTCNAASAGDCTFVRDIHG